MRYTSLILAFACVVLVPFVTQAEGTMLIYYTFDSSSGDTVADQSKFHNDGTMEDNPEVTDGQSGKGLAFADSQVTILASDSLSADLFSEGLFTIVVWINRVSAGKQWQAIFTSDGPPKTYDTLFLNQNGLLSWRGRVDGQWAGGMCETDPGVVEVGKWTHVAVVSDEKNFRIYVNGQLTKESDFQQTDGGNVEYYLGNSPYRPDPHEYGYNGIMDEFAIFDTALTEAEIKSLINTGVAQFAPVEPGGKLAIRWANLKIVPSRSSLPWW
jgi:hypothetical protein